MRAISDSPRAQPILPANTVQSRAPARNMTGMKSFWLTVPGDESPKFSGHCIAGPTGSCCAQGPQVAQSEMSHKPV